VYKMHTRESTRPRLPWVLALALLVTACSEYELIRPDFTDVFFQDPPSAVDILLVVDDSGSMQDEQTKLSAGFEEFVEYFEFADVDYHIGVITTDMDAGQDSGKLQGDPRWIEPSTPDRATAFANNVQVGIQGSGNERGLDAARVALGQEMLNGYNAGFIREEAYLSLIFVSDEEDSSWEPVANYINFFWSVKGNREREAFNASALVGADEAGDAADCGDLSSLYTGARAAYRYVDVAHQTEGVVRSICEEDFTPIITEMGLNSSRLTDRFEFSRAPDPLSLELEITPEGEDEAIAVPPDHVDWPWVYEWDEAADGYHYWLVFPGNLPPVNCKIVVRYDAGDGFGSAPEGDDDTAGN